MSKIANIFLCLPLTALLSIYLYVLATIIALNSTAFYTVDPKNTPIGFLYEGLLIFTVLGHLGILTGFVLVVMDLCEFKGKLTSKSFKYIYFMGSALTVFTHYVDVGYCQIWFFD